MADAPRPTPRHHTPITVIALVLALAAIVQPLVALPAVIVCFLVFVVVSGRRRLLVAGLAAPLALAAFVRFVLVDAAPNIVGSGQNYAEEKAVSRLREILWAEEQAQQARLSDTNGDGVGEFLGLEGLVRPQQDLLKPGLYKPVAGKPGVYRVEGYYFVVYVPPQPPLSQTRWLGYAWPAGEKHGGDRTFVIDENEQICQSTQPPYVGEDHGPTVFAALQAPSFEAPVCGKGTDGGEWTAWRKKKARSGP